MNDINTDKKEETSPTISKLNSLAKKVLKRMLFALVVLIILFIIVDDKDGVVDEKERVIDDKEEGIIEKKSVIQQLFPIDQQKFLDELDKRITEFYNRKDLVDQKVKSNTNPHRNPGVNWKEYHDFLYEQIKWLTNTSYNEFYNSDVLKWKSKISGISQKYATGVVGEYGNPPRKVIFRLIADNNLLSMLETDSLVQFSGSWDTSPRDGQEWKFKDSKPILGEYVSPGISSTSTYGIYFDYNGNPVEPREYVNYTEKDIGQIDDDLSNNPKKPLNTRVAEKLLKELYNYIYDWPKKGIAFLIKVSNFEAL